MTFASILEAVSAVITLVGIYLTGKYNKWGWAIQILGNCLWIGVSYISGLWFMLVMNVAFFALNIKNFKNWHTNHDRSKSDRGTMRR